MTDAPCDSGIVQVTSLLKAHAALISDTSETFAFEVAARVKEIQENPEDKELVKHSSYALLSLLQTQDILRQQVDVLKSGLDTLASAPSPMADETWLESSLDQIAGTYVMQSQYDIHSETLGIPPEEPGQTSADNVVLF